MSEIEPKQKRKRNALSCNDCRRRKEKCDRQMPCSSCAVRRGAVCHYDPPKKPPTVSAATFPKDTSLKPSEKGLLVFRDLSFTADSMPPTITPQPLPLFLNAVDSKWLTGVAHPPLRTYLTRVCAVTSIEALKGMNKSREFIWHTGKVIGKVSHRISHVSAYRSLPDDVAEAVALLEKIELLDDSADAVSQHVECLQTLVKKGDGLKAFQLDGVINGIMLVSVGVLSVILCRPFPAKPAAGFDRPFDSSLLSSSPLSAFHFLRSSHLLRLEDGTAKILASMKDLTLQCTGRQKTYSGIVDDDSCALLQCQPDGVYDVISNAAHIYERSIAIRLPFFHCTNWADRQKLTASIMAIYNIDEAFRYMPGVLVWALLVACASVGQQGAERRFLLPALQRWCMALGFCTNAAQVLEMLSSFATVERYIGSSPGDTKAQACDGKFDCNHESSGTQTHATEASQFDWK